jgi:hypothetical protein
MRLAALLLVIQAFAPVLQGSLRNFVSLDATPTFAVCTIEEVITLGRVEPGESRVPWRERRFESHVLVRRVYFKTPARPFEPGTRVLIYYKNPEQLGGGGGLPAPSMLELRPRETVLIPLTQANGRWIVQQDESRNPVVPALVTDHFMGSPRTGRAFVFRELVQVLAHGDALQRNRVAAYLNGFTGDVPGELPHLMAGAFGSDDDLWLEVGCAFLGVPNLNGTHNHLELIYGQASPPFHDLRQLITWVLRKGDRRDYPNRLIRRLVHNAYAYDWGAALTLVEFKDSNTLVGELTAAMRRNCAGSITIARPLVNAGQRAVLPEGLELAQRLLIASDIRSTELSSAAELLMRYGDDRQFETLVAALDHFKRTNPKHYGELWNEAVQCPNPQNRRVLRLAAVLIGDHRPKFDDVRYCDIAASAVQRISGIDFGLSEQMSIQERDSVVSRVAGWLYVHGAAR